MSDNEDRKRELIDDRSMWKSLQEHEGFKRLCQVAKAQLDSRRNTRISMRVKTAEDVAEYNMLQGEELALELFMKIPEIQVEMLNEEIKGE